jgi:hypothetical protein
LPVVADDDGGPAPIAQQIGNGSAAVGVEFVGRFVEEDHIGLGEEQPGKSQPCALPTAEGFKQAVGRERGQPDPLQGGVDPIGQGPVSFASILHAAMAGLKPGKAIEIGGNAEAFGNGLIVIDLHGLAQHAERAGDSQRAGGGRQSPGDEPQQGRFAAAVAADQSSTMRTENEIEAGEERLIVRVGVRELLERDRGGHRRIPDGRCG